MPINLMGIMKIIGLAYSRVHGAKDSMDVADGSYAKRTHWAVSVTRPRITRRNQLASRYAVESLFAAAQYRINMAFEEAVVELRSVLDLASVDCWNTGCSSMDELIRQFNG